MQMINLGICGATTENIFNAEIPQVESFKPTLSILLAGTNDSCNPASLRSNEDIRISYEKILLSLQKINSKIFVMTLPPVIERAFMARHQAEEFLGKGPTERLTEANKIIVELAKKYHAEVIDINETLNSFDLESNDSPLLNDKNFTSNDGCHPNEAGYAIIANMLFERIVALSVDYSKVACIGDSITYGFYMEGAGTAEGKCYPGQLHDLLKSHSPTVE